MNYVVRLDDFAHRRFRGLVVFLVLPTGRNVAYVVIFDVKNIIRVGLDPVGPMREILSRWLDDLFRLDGANQ